MLPMQGLTDQGPPHEIPPEAAADYSHTGWEGGFERGGPEVYTYTAGEDYDMLVIRIDEVFYDEPNDDFPEDELDEEFPDDELDEESPEDERERWEVDKRYSNLARRMPTLRRPPRRGNPRTAPARPIGAN